MPCLDVAIWELNSQKVYHKSHILDVKLLKVGFQIVNVLLITSGYRYVGNID